MHAALATGSAPAQNAAPRGIAPARNAFNPPALGATRVLGRDEEVFAEGERAAFFYKVVAGAVRSFKLLSDGRRQVDAFHLPGDIFGIEAGEEHRVGAEAVADTTLVAYRRCGLESLAGGDGAHHGPHAWSMLGPIDSRTSPCP